MTKLCSVMALTTINGFVAVWLLVTCVLSVILLHLVAVFFALLSVVDICTCQVGLEIFQVLEDKIQGERESTKKTKMVEI